MVSVVHVYNRWSKSEIRCYVDGQMVSGTDMSWLVSTSDVSTSYGPCQAKKYLHIILHMRKVSSGHLLSIEAFFSIQ